MKILLLPRGEYLISNFVNLDLFAHPHRKKLSLSQTAKPELPTVVSCMNQKGLFELEKVAGSSLKLASSLRMWRFLLDSGPVSFFVCYQSSRESGQKAKSSSFFGLNRP